LVALSTKQARNVDDKLRFVHLGNLVELFLDGLASAHFDKGGGLLAGDVGYLGTVQLHTTADGLRLAFCALLVCRGYGKNKHNHSQRAQTQADEETVGVYRLQSGIVDKFLGEEKCRKQNCHHTKKQHDDGALDCAEVTLGLGLFCVVFC